MIAIIDYGVGNLFSLQSSFRAIGAEVTVTGDPKVIRRAERVVLPGVGAFRDASAKLSRDGLDVAVKECAAAGVPLLGICLGMQLLFERSFEFGEYRGLGLIPGDIRPIADVIPDTLKIPHIGWNRLIYPKENEPHPLFSEIQGAPYVYFVHSYYAACPSSYVTARTDYGAPLTAAVASENVMGCQFHPEKSGDVGLSILRAFCTRPIEDFTHS